MSQSTKIAKNTFIMYIRMFVMLLIGLYTSRVVLNTLGVSDYGIYNVVGGVVSMFAVISSSLSSSISRFITFEIGHGDISKLKDIFSTSVLAQVILAIFMFLIMELVGIWFLNYKMNIPITRLGAANMVMHCSILTFVFALINTPFNAEIIAHERFGIFAYITLAEACLKLLIVYILDVSPYDKLKTYAVLLLLVAVVFQVVYIVYCKKMFEECTIRLRLNKKLIKEMTGFAGWSFWGNASWILNSQGIDVLINLFFGVTLNAARGIANQVNSVVQGFVSNFTVTLNPQITKSYAQNNFDNLHKLVFVGAKYSYFLMLIFSIPICLETKQLLVLWLKVVPDYSVIFVRLTLISTMIFVLGMTLTVAQSSTGKMKRMAMGTSLLTFLEFPFVYICFKYGMSAISCYIVHIVIYFTLLFVKIQIVKRDIRITCMAFIRSVLFKVLLVTILAIPIPMFVYCQLNETVLRLLLVSFASILSSLLFIYCLGMNNNERKILISYVKNKISL